MAVNPRRKAEAMDETGLPASIEAAWGLRDRPQKGPKPGLSLDRIVDAAIKVADAEGLAAVSMSRVATELGAATMSLYRYVGAKDELLELMVDAAIGPPPPDSGDRGWRAGLTTWAVTYLTLLRQRPWVVRVPLGTPPITPNSIAWMERCLRIMQPTALTAAEKLSAILLISGFVRSSVSLEADIAGALEASGGASGQVIASYGRLLARLTDPERFPAVRELVATGVFDEQPGPDEDPLGADFDFGLERILDGIEAHLRRRARHRSARP
jgi:AcrR family transcriptional regulator